MRMIDRFRAHGWLPLLLVLLSLPVVAAPEADRHYRLLILDSQLGNPYDEVRAALFAGLERRGYVRGRNLEVSLRAAGNDAEAGEAILREEAAKGYDVLFVGGTVATIAAKRALYGSLQPVVFAAPTDPVGIGVIDDFDSPPKANFTGVCYPVPVKARLRFLRQLLPEARTLGLIYADMPQSHSYNGWIRELLESDPEFADLRVIFRPVPLVTGEEGDRRMAELARPIIQELDGQVDAFIKPNDQLGTRRAFSEAVWGHATKPLVGLVKNDVMGGWGATAVVYPSHESIGEQAAEMVSRLFEGATVDRLTPQWPVRYGYAVDLPKSRRFGMTVSVGILQLAGRNIIK